jgi:predicted phage-related endonuclease
MTAELLMTAAEVDADRDRWRKLRLEGVTASEMPLVCGIAPPSWGGPYKLYRAKTTGEDLVRDTDEMRRGRVLEPLVLEDFERTHPGLVLIPGGLYCNTAARWQMATFDAQAVDHDTYAAVRLAPGRTRPVPWLIQEAADPALDIWPVQAKTAVIGVDWGWEEDTDQIPAHTRCQVLWEMKVRDADRAFVVVKIMQSWETRTYIIDRDAEAEAELEWMTAQAEEFLDRVATRTPPPVDWLPSTTDALRAMHTGEPAGWVRVPWRMARRYKAALAAADKVKRRRGLVVNQMLDRAGDAQYIVARDPATGRDVRVASRTIGDRKAYEVPAQSGVHRLNPCGWARTDKRGN